jgi:hypothetical protein
MKKIILSAIVLSVLFGSVVTSKFTPSAKAITQHQWSKIDNGLTQPYSITGMIKLNNEAYATIRNLQLPNGQWPNSSSGLFKFSESSNSWIKVAEKPTKYDINYPITVDGQIYATSNGRLYKLVSNTWQAISNSPTMQNGKAIEKLSVNTTTKKIVGIVQSTSSNAVVAVYDTVNNSWSETVSEGLPTKRLDSHNSVVINDNNEIFVAFTWSFGAGWVDGQGATQGGVYKYQNNSWKDITGGTGGYRLGNWRNTDGKLAISNAGALDVMNMTGSGPGPIGNVSLNTAGNSVMVSTEQGVFEYKTDNWEKIISSWGNQNLLKTENKTLVFNGRSGYSIWDGTKSVDVGNSDFYNCKYQRIYSTVMTATKIFAGVLNNDGSVCKDTDTTYKPYMIDIPTTTSSQTSNIKLNLGSYIAGNGVDKVKSTKIIDENTIVTAGNFSGISTSTSILGSTNADQGYVIKQNRQTGAIISAVKLGAKVDDMDFSNGKIAVSGSFGLALLNSDMTLAWTNTFAESTKTRVSIGNDGKVASFGGKELKVYSSTGSILQTITVDHDYLEDVVLDSEKNQVIITGFDNRRNNLPVQISYINSFDITSGQLLWKTFGFDETTVGADMADTRGYRISLGQDGQLYYLGESAGGNTIYRWNGKDLLTPKLSFSDIYNQAFNTKSAHMGYYAQVSRTNGEVTKSQMIIPRLKNNGMLSNTFRAKDGSITADINGNIAVTGISASSFAGRDTQKVNGVPISPYSGGDGVIFVFSSDLKTRRVFTTPSKNNASGNMSTADFVNGNIVVGGNITKGEYFTTANASTPSPSSNISDAAPDGYVFGFKLD